MIWSYAGRVGALGTASLCLSISGLARATDATEVVVSATRTERSVDLVPSDVSVVTAATLKTRTFDRLDEALNAEAGIYGGRVRGTSSTSHTLIMLNGMPLNSGWYGGVNWQNVSMENVDRIEIVRGPASALYGGNAMGGAINVITVLPEQFEANLQTRVGSDDYASYHGSIGDKYFGRLAVRLGAEYDNDLIGRPLDYVFRPVTAGAGTLTGGESSLNRQGRDYWIVGDKGEQHQRQWSANLAAAYDLFDTGRVRLDWQNGYAKYYNDAPSSYVLDGSGQAAFTGNVATGASRRVTIDPSLFLAGNGMDDNSATMLTYTDNLASVDVVARLGYQHENKWYTTVNANSGNYLTATGNVREFDTGTSFADLQGTKALGRVTLTGGFSAKRNEFDQTQYNVTSYRDDRTKTGGVTELTQGSDRYSAAYLQGEVALTDSLKAYLGGRYDKWSADDGLSGPARAPLRLADADDSAFSPGASLVWEASASTVLHASVAKAFSPPNIYDRYRTFVSGTTVFLSNPDLGSESLVNHEIGIVQYAWDKRVRFALTGFVMKYRNLVYSSTFDDVGDVDGNALTTSVTQSANAGRARNRGFELTLNAKVTSWLDVWGNYAENHTKITENALAPVTVGKRFTYSPDRGASVGADARYGWMKASVISTYTGHIFRTADNSDRSWGVYQSDSVRWLTDLKLSAVLPTKVIGAQSTTLSLSVRNLFDRDYFEYTIGRPRSYYFDVGLKF
jgi:iron complex outermembrane receptor protein